MTANGVAAWKDLDGDGIATATLNSSGGSPDANSVTTGTIVDGAIIDADINAAAGIAVSKLAAGTATYVLTSTSGTAVWSAPASGAPSGAAGGSLTGTYPNPTIATIPSGATATTQTAADGSTKVATTAYVDTADALKANLASPTFTGHPVGVTEAALNNSTRLASTAYADAAVAVENSRATTAEGLLAPLASPTFTGTPSLPTGTTGTTQSAADSSTKVATTAFVTTADNLKANLAGPTFTGTVTLPSTTVAVTPSASDNSTKPATTAYVDTADALKANLASPAFTGTPSLPTGTTGTTQSINDASTKLATTAYITAQTKATGAAYQIGPNTYSNIPYMVTGSQIAVANAGDGRWCRVMMGQSGTLHDVSFLVNTTGGNYNILVLDDGQANATHTTRTCLYIKGSTATPAASAYITGDAALTVAAGDTLVFMVTFDGTAAKVGSSTGSLGGIALPANFFPGSGASTATSKVCGTALSANIPASVNATITDGNMVAAANAPFCVWRIT